MSNGYISLHIAAQMGRTTIVDLLLRADARDNETKKPANGYTALYIAVHEGHAAVVKLLLNAGLELRRRHKRTWNRGKWGLWDCDRLSDDRKSPLQAAANNRDADIVSLLLKAGADPNPVARYHDTPLCTASSDGEVTIAEMLLDAGVDVNDRKLHCTALFAAAENGHVEMARMLIARGAQVDLVSPVKAGDGCRATPLYIASLKGHATVVRLLL
jgi:ankyrin repeat protein